MLLTGEDGTVYQFNPATCQLTPVEGTGGADDDGAALEGAGVGAAVTEESTEASEDEKLIEESEEVSEPQVKELTESQQIVSNLIKSLSA
jgi:hypothetical protein